MSKTCGTGNNGEHEMITRYKKYLDDVRDHAGNFILNARDESAAYLRAYRMEQARAEALEQVALDMLDEIGGMEITNFGGKETPIADDYADRLRALGVEVSQ